MIISSTHEFNFSSLYLFSSSLIINKKMSVYGINFDDISSPIEELKDVPFSRYNNNNAVIKLILLKKIILIKFNRISKTIMKPMEEQGGKRY